MFHGTIHNQKAWTNHKNKYGISAQRWHRWLGGEGGLSGFVLYLSGASPRDRVNEMGGLLRHAGEREPGVGGGAVGAAAGVFRRGGPAGGERASARRAARRRARARARRAARAAHRRRGLQGAYVCLYLCYSLLSTPLAAI